MGRHATDSDVGPSSHGLSESNARRWIATVGAFRRGPRVESAAEVPIAGWFFYEYDGQRYYLSRKSKHDHEHREADAKVARPDFPEQDPTRVIDRVFREDLTKMLAEPETAELRRLVDGPGELHPPAPSGPIVIPPPELVLGEATQPLAAHDVPNVTRTLYDKHGVKPQRIAELAGLTGAGSHTTVLQWHEGTAEPDALQAQLLESALLDEQNRADQQSGLEQEMRAGMQEKQERRRHRRA